VEVAAVLDGLAHPAYDGFHPVAAQHGGEERRGLTA
jgi:hypothetical protein